MKLLLVLVVLLGGCGLYIDRAGKIAWRKVAAHLAEEGENTDFLSMLRPAIPEAENFCALPVLRRAQAGVGEFAARLTLPGKVDVLSHAGELAKGKPIDLGELARAMRRAGTRPATAPGPAEEIATALAQWDPALEEMTGGLTRRRAQWTPPLVERARRPFLAAAGPEVAPVLNLARVLALRAIVAAQVGDSREAVDYLSCLERLGTATFDEPLLVYQTAGHAIEAMMACAAWEICRRQGGNPEDWGRMERAFSRFDAQKLALRGFRGELAAEVESAFHLRETGDAETAKRFGLHPRYGAGLLLPLLPPGLFEAIAAEIVQKELRFILRPLRDGDLQGLCKAERDFQLALASRPQVPWNLAWRASKETLTGLANTLSKVIYSQTIANQAAIACVLERARLSTGKYPITLDGLTLADGRPLPGDPASGGPMLYRRTPERYVLYSVGPDGFDDRTYRNMSGAALVSCDYRGDWVWGFPP